MILPRLLSSCAPSKLRYLPWIATFAASAVAATVCRASDLPLTNVDGTLCLRVTLRTEAAEVPAHVVLDLGTRGPMLVHYGTAALLGFGSESAVDVIDQESGATLAAVKSVAMALEPLEELTRDHAKELGDIPAVAVIGLPAFSGMRVELDVAANLLRIEAPTAAPAVPPGPAAGTEIKLAPEAYGYWTTAQVPGGRDLRVRFSTSEYDTRIDGSVAETLGHPGGDVPRLMLGNIDLMQHVVLRPSDMSGFPEPKPEVTLGTQFFSAFRVRVDPDDLRLILVPTGRPAVPLHERGFFVARARRDLAGVEAFVRAHRDSRLAGEAAEALLQLCLEQEHLDSAVFKRALSVRAEAAPVERRAMTLVTAADELIALDQERTDAYDLALVALELAKPYCSQDLNDAALHHINARLGLIAMLRRDYEQARRWLLSAAFGLPKDPYINFYLGYLYERTGQRSRAWSRYIEACLKKDPPIGAVQGLNRLNNDPSFRKTFTMFDAEQLLEGRLPEFIPPRKWSAAETPNESPVPLVELFTSTLVPETQAAQMAFDGLARYLEGADTVLIEYHVDDMLSSDAGEARKAFYEVQKVPAALFGGAGPVVEGGEDEAAPQVFAAYRKAAISAMARPAASQPAVSGEARLDNANLGLEIAIPAAFVRGQSVLHVILCERAVLCPGDNGRLIHRHVARAILTPEQGMALDVSQNNRFQVEIGLWAAGRRLEQRVEEFGQRLGFRPAIRPTWIDPEQCEVIAFVQDVDSKAIHWAASVPVHRKEGAR